MSDTSQYPNAHPQVANVAVSQAKNLGKNLKVLAVNGSLREYEYTDRGVMATIGRNKAVVKLPSIKLKG